MPETNPETRPETIELGISKQTSKETRQIKHGRMSRISDEILPYFRTNKLKLHSNRGVGGEVRITRKLK